MIQSNEFGRWVRAMRRHCDVTLLEMANDFSAKSSDLCALEVSRDGATYTDRQKRLIRAYFKLVCEEKGIAFPTVETQREKAEKREKREKEAAKHQEMCEMKSLHDIFKGFFN